MKKVFLILFTLLAVNNTYAQQIPNIKNSWLGNSNADPNTSMPQGLEGMCVSKDGTVYTNVMWEEGGSHFTGIKDGNVVHGATSGWTYVGGADAANNSTYVYFAIRLGNENGNLVDPNRYPAAGLLWQGVSRRLKSDITQAAPFVGGQGWPTGSMKVILEYPELEENWINGMYATETELFVSIGKKNIVKVYDATSMVFKREFTAANPHQIAMDSQGNLWIAQGFDATKIKRYTPTGTLLPQSLTLPAGSLLGDFCIDKNDRIIIGDVGPKEQVRIYNNIFVNPDFTSTFGALNGIHSGVSGRNAPLKFQQIRGVGVDTLGNIYIGNTQWHTGGQGAIVEKYNLTTSAMAWKRYCVMFVDAMGIDAGTDGEDVYGKVEHFKVDYTKPEGQDAYYSAYTIDRYKYPADPRLWEQFASVLVKNIKGHKFLA